MEEALFTLLGVDLGMLLRDFGLKVLICSVAVAARLAFDVVLPFFSEAVMPGIS